MTDEDPEISEVTELAQIERRKMNLPRAHHILITIAILVVIAAILFVIFQR